MATGAWITHHTRCSTCGRNHAAERRATRIACQCGEEFDPAARTTRVVGQDRSDDRLRRFRRRLREAVVLNDAVARVLVVLSITAWGGYLATGSEMDVLRALAAVLTALLVGFVAMARRVENARSLTVHARFWGALSLFSRAAARRARALVREARRLRAMGLIINSQDERKSK